VVDIGKQIAYWRKGALEDWEVASHLIERGNIRHGLFFVHLAIEKALKALICRNTNDLAPKDHNLLRLAQKAGLALTAEQESTLSETNTFNIEGRYPDLLYSLPRRSRVKSAALRAKEMLQWLIGQL
jgi:HEPN domain-containing protein